jgi:hypothetical protein
MKRALDDGDVAVCIKVCGEDFEDRLFCDFSHFQLAHEELKWSSILNKKIEEFMKMRETMVEIKKKWK